MMRSGAGSSRASDAACGRTVNVPPALRIVSPCCRTAARVLGRKRKETSGLFLAKWAPKYPPTDPAPTIMICFMLLLVGCVYKPAYYSMCLQPDAPTPMSSGSDLGILREKLSGARSLTVLTGAGISADSGVPTFRGADGLWRSFRAEDLATPEAFARDPRLVWEWYNWRRELIAAKRPNPAHEAIVELERRIPSFWLITQNV